MAVLIARPKLALKTIVVKTDFSAASERALQYAIGIARHYGAKIDLVYGVDREEQPRASGTRETAGDGNQQFQAEAKLSLQVAKCGDIGCSSWIFTGTSLDVVERILSFEKADLVVVGTQLAKEGTKRSAGAAAEHFFRHVTCPVLAVGPAVQDVESSFAPRRVLLPTDLQSDESLAAKCAVLLAREHDAELSLLYVAQRAPVPFPEDQRLTARPYYQARLRELMSYKPELEYPAEFLVEFGNPVTEILRVAKEKPIDLLVLSVRREEAWGFHFAHQAYGIVEQAPCPVLITQRGV